MKISRPDDMPPTWKHDNDTGHNSNAATQNKKKQ